MISKTFIEPIGGNMGIILRVILGLYWGYIGIISGLYFRLRSLGVWGLGALFTYSKQVKGSRPFGIWRFGG